MSIRIRNVKGDYCLTTQELLPYMRAIYQHLKEDYGNYFPVVKSCYGMDVNAIEDIEPVVQKVLKKTTYFGGKKAFVNAHGENIAYTETENLMGFSNYQLYFKTGSDRQPEFYYSMSLGAPRPTNPIHGNLMQFAGVMISIDKWELLSTEALNNLFLKEIEYQQPNYACIENDDNVENIYKKDNEIASEKMYFKDKALLDASDALIQLGCTLTPFGKGTVVDLGYPDFTFSEEKRQRIIQVQDLLIDYGLLLKSRIKDIDWGLYAPYITGTNLLYEVPIPGQDKPYAFNGYNANEKKLLFATQWNGYPSLESGLAPTYVKLIADEQRSADRKGCGIIWYISNATKAAQIKAILQELQYTDIEVQHVPYPFDSSAVWDGATYG